MRKGTRRTRVKTGLVEHVQWSTAKSRSGIDVIANVDVPPRWPCRLLEFCPHTQTHHRIGIDIGEHVSTCIIRHCGADDGTSSVQHLHSCVTYWSDNHAIEIQPLAVRMGRHELVADCARHRNHGSRLLNRNVDDVGCSHCAVADGQLKRQGLGNTGWHVERIEIGLRQGAVIDRHRRAPDLCPRIRQRISVSVEATAAERDIGQLSHNPVVACVRYRCRIAAAAATATIAPAAAGGQGEHGYRNQGDAGPRR